MVVIIYIYIYIYITIWNIFLINNKYHFNNEMFDLVKYMKMIQYLNVVKKVIFLILFK